MHEQQKAKEFEETHLDVLTLAKKSSLSGFIIPEIQWRTPNLINNIVFFCIVGQQMPSVVTIVLKRF